MPKCKKEDLKKKKKVLRRFSWIQFDIKLIFFRDHDASVSCIAAHVGFKMEIGVFRTIEKCWVAQAARPIVARPWQSQAKKYYDLQTRNGNFIPFFFLGVERVLIFDKKFSFVCCHSK